MNQWIILDTFEFLMGMTEKAPYFLMKDKVKQLKVQCEDFLKSYVSVVSIEALSGEALKSKREKSVTFTDQLATIGGTLGLFTGMSILSMVEIICFVFNLSSKALNQTTQ